MMYDIEAYDKEQDLSFRYLVKASNATEINVLMRGNIPSGAEITQVFTNPDIKDVTIIDKDAEKIIKVVTSPKVDSWGEVTPFISSNDVISFCLANSIQSVLNEIDRLGFKGELKEVSLYTDGVTYLH